MGQQIAVVIVGDLQQGATRMMTSGEDRAELILDLERTRYESFFYKYGNPRTEILTASHGLYYSQSVHTRNTSRYAGFRPYINPEAVRWTFLLSIFLPEKTGSYPLKAKRGALFFAAPTPLPLPAWMALRARETSDKRQSVIRLGKSHEFIALLYRQQSMDKE